MLLLPGSLQGIESHSARPAVSIYCLTWFESAAFAVHLHTVDNGNAQREEKSEDSGESTRGHTNSEKL
ncbi:MAG: hypothetical protein AMXMBFR82_45140 [Candidatus Hydrogenedentota bacterium]